MDYIRTLAREFDVGGRLELAIENRSGVVTVRGEDTTDVRLDVVAHLWAEDEDEAADQLELISRGIKHDGQRLTIRAPALLRPKPFFFFGRSPRIDYTLAVPRNCRASITSWSGRAEVENISGPLELIGRSGRVSAREIAGDVTVDKSSGHSQLEGIGGTVTVESKSGGVRVHRCRKTCTVKSRSGSVQVEDVQGDVDVDTRSGTAAVSDAGGAVKITARSGSIRYEGGVHGPIDIEVWSGSVRVAVEPGSVFFIDAESTHGSVRSEMPMRSESTEPPPGAPTMRLRTRAGSILIAPR